MYLTVCAGFIAWGRGGCALRNSDRRRPGSLGRLGFEVRWAQEPGCLLVPTQFLLPGPPARCRRHVQCANELGHGAESWKAAGPQWGTGLQLLAKLVGTL